MNMESVSCMSSCKCCRAPCLDSLNLGKGERLTVEARREFISIKVDTLGWSDRAELGPGNSANAYVGFDGLAERAELLSMVAIGAERHMRGVACEGRWERARRRCGMGLRRVVDRCCHEITVSIPSHKVKVCGSYPRR